MDRQLNTSPLPLYFRWLIQTELLSRDKTGYEKSTKWHRVLLCQTFEEVMQRAEQRSKYEIEKKKGGGSKKWTVM